MAWSVRLRNLGPQSSERGRQVIHEFCKLARIELLPEGLEHGATHGQRIHRKLWWQFFQNVVGKFLDASIFRRLPGHMPAFIVDTAHQGRKLSTEMHRDLRGQPVAQRMQHGPQRNVGVVAILKVQILSDRPELGIGFLNGVIQRGDA